MTVFAGVLIFLWMVTPLSILHFVRTEFKEAPKRIGSEIPTSGKVELLLMAFLALLMLLSTPFMVPRISDFDAWSNYSHSKQWDFLD